MKKETKPKHFLQKPEYNGGLQAMKKFIIDNLQYPKDAIEKGIQGTVKVRYEIGQDGGVTKAKAIAGIGGGCDEEAERIVKLMRFLMPKNRGVKAIFHNTVNIHFKLNKPKTIEVPIPSVSDTAETSQGSVSFSINYVTATAKPEAEPKAPAAGNSFVITYKIG